MNAPGLTQNPVAACGLSRGSFLLETAPAPCASGTLSREVTVTCPWPSATLSPNARLGWANRARVTKAYRARCAEAASNCGVSPATGTWTLEAIRFVPPNGRARDLDNLVASFKAGQDGLADAAGANDRDWRPRFDLADEPQPGGCVIARMRNTEIPG